MNSAINIVRQKAMYEKICDFKTSGALFFPREDSNGTMYVVSQAGEIFCFNEGSSEQIFSMNGQPNCICFDSTGSLYIAEVSCAAVFYKSHCKNLMFIKRLIAVLL